MVIIPPFPTAIKHEPSIRTSHIPHLILMICNGMPTSGNNVKISNAYLYPKQLNTFFAEKVPKGNAAAKEKIVIPLTSSPP